MTASRPSSTCFDNRAHAIRVAGVVVVGVTVVVDIREVRAGDYSAKPPVGTTGRIIDQNLLFLCIIYGFLKSFLDFIIRFLPVFQAGDLLVNHIHIWSVSVYIDRKYSDRSLKVL